MKNFRELQFKKAYDSDRDDLLRDFFIPALSTAVKYERLAGFFSSGILSAAARGISGFINNEGKMKLIVGAKLHDEDIKVVEEFQKNPELYLEKVLLSELDAIFTLLKKNHLDALGWMLANGLLEIKVAVVRGGGLFHMKVGIMEDEDGNKISFSGSDNETPSGWRYNAEEFKVFRNWITEENDYYSTDKEKFDRFWEGKGDQVISFSLPDAVRKKIIAKAPKRKEDIFFNEKTFPNSTDIIEAKELILRPHQIKAIEALKTKNYCGILSMATGSGKTITALSLVKELFYLNKKISVIAVPREFLVNQWIKKDIRQMFPDANIIEIHGGAGDWRKKLKLILPGLSVGKIKHLFVVGLYGSLASEDYIEIMSSANLNSNDIIYVADEVHNLGATEAQKGMLDIYSNRIGLSATPGRYFDEEGTDLIIKYFGGIVYEYTIKDAINDGFLTPYNYYPNLVCLDINEYEEYSVLSRKISLKIAIGKGNKNDILKKNEIKNLLIQRSRILKNAKGKIEKTEQIIRNLLVNLQNKSLSHILIYCDNKEQVGFIQEILKKLDIINHKFTEDESSIDRELLLKNFSEGKYQALVAVKCLDEGLDIPEARIAIIVASTTNPREYIQRRGRVLRKALGKTEAEIYDLFVVPPDNLINSDDKIESIILEKEFDRIRYFLDASQNPSLTFKKLISIMKKYGIYL